METVLQLNISRKWEE